MACYVVGDCEEDERVQVYMEVGGGGFVGGEEGGRGGRHAEGWMMWIWSVITANPSKRTFEAEVKVTFLIC